MPERVIEVHAEDRQGALQVAPEVAGQYYPHEDGRVWVTFRVVDAVPVPWDPETGRDPEDLRFAVTLQGDYMTESEARAMGGDR